MKHFPLNRYWRAVRKRGIRWKWPRKFLLIKDAPTIDCLCIRMIRVEPPYLLCLFMNVCSICQPDASQQSQWIAASYKDMHSCISSNILDRVILTTSPHLPRLCFDSMLWVDVCLLLTWFHILGLLCLYFLLPMQWFRAFKFCQVNSIFIFSFKKINKIKHFFWY